MLLYTLHDHFCPDSDVFYPLTKIREAKVTLITPERIKILRLREELIFEASAIGLYMSLDGKKVTSNNTGTTILLFGFSFVIKTRIMTSGSFQKCRIKTCMFLSICFQSSTSPTLVSPLYLYLIPS